MLFYSLVGPIDLVAEAEVGHRIPQGDVLGRETMTVNGHPLVVTSTNETALMTEKTNEKKVN